ncbi:hypothetical protein HYU82_00865 [Candidatus Saccharibacteria bacterium]|nr:hypothetical protein [Candidatus Saccharibacteria bacterium]
MEREPTGGGENTSDCIASGSTTLEWILCPVTTGIGKLTDGINLWVEDLLEFNTDKSLPDSGGARDAWVAIKNLASLAIVILMLVMVISQALGSGPFEAYTVRKVLPKLAVAVIALQISWEATLWVIGIANDLGNGIKDILTSPFGGAGNMDLNSLLKNLDGKGIWSGVTNFTLVAMIIAAITFFSPFLWLFVLVVFSLLVSVLIALATLMFRNVLIIASVIFVPLAIIAWVLPGTERYWKLWKDNFIKLLLLFPLMIIIIYSGRIAAYIAGNLGLPGILDFIFVLVAFFAPYFIIFKAFKWGGGALAAASAAMNQSKIIGKGSEFARKEILGAHERRSGEGSEYNPFEPAVGIRAARIKLPFTNKRIPVAPKITGRVVPRIVSGHVMPTDRSRALTALKYEQWKKDREAEREAYETAGTNAAKKGEFDGSAYKYDSATDRWKEKRYQKGIDKGPGPAKAAMEQMMISPDSRLRKVTRDDYLKKSSWIEIENNATGIDLDHPDRQQRRYNRQLHAQLVDLYGDHMFGENGSRRIRDPETNQYTNSFMMRPYEHPEFTDHQTADEEMWKLVAARRSDLNPPTLETTYPEYVSPAEAAADPVKAGKRRSEIKRIQENQWDLDDDDWQRVGGKRLSDAHRIALSMRDSYVGPSNIGSMAQGYLQEISRSNNVYTSAQFANILASLAKGGPSAATQMVNMAGGEGSDLMAELNKALSHVQTVDGKNVNFMDYVAAARNSDVSAIPKIVVPPPKSPGTPPPPSPPAPPPAGPTQPGPAPTPAAPATPEAPPSTSSNQPSPATGSAAGAAPAGGATAGGPAPRAAGAGAFGLGAEAEASATGTPRAGAYGRPEDLAENTASVQNLAAEVRKLRRQQQPTEVVREIPTEGGVIHIQQEPTVVTLKPGEQVSEGGILRVPERRTRPPEEPPESPPAT